jgi:hypothetical protein
MLDDPGNLYDPYSVGSEFLRNHEKEKLYLINAVLAREKKRKEYKRRSKADRMAIKFLWKLTRPNTMRQNIDLFFFMALFGALIVLFFF